MKIILYTFIFCFIMAQGYSQVIDTVGHQVAAEPLNLNKVKKMLVYPDYAKENKIEGRVIIKLLVDTNGIVEKTGSIAGPEIFYNEVKRVAMFLKFSPAKLSGKVVPIWTTIPFIFKLENN